jgi:predicted ATP-binding protein involved in virulence
MANRPPCPALVIVGRGSVPQLNSLRVFGLLGEFDHSFEFPEKWEFVILHGPNGVGKTKLLQLVVGVYSADYNAIVSTPFNSAEFGFDDGMTIAVSRIGQAAFPEMEDSGEIASAPVILRMLARDGTEVDHWAPSPEPRSLAQLARYIDHEMPFLHRVERNLWIDQRNEQIHDLQSLYARWPVLRRHYRAGDLTVEESDEGLAIRNYLAQLQVHLIETQRLLLSREEGNDRHERGVVPRVETFAQDLTQRLSAALAQNSRTSQRLDRSFPRRLLSASSTVSPISDEQIRERYDAQSLLRNQLAAIGVLDGAEDLPLPPRTLADWERRVLWNYLEDTADKLSTFSELLAKVNLLTEIVNSRFLYKELRIDPARGFSFITRRGTIVRADQLSSGEQHELVLVYDLLFNVSPGSLVLIDEPEISLHVGWQQKFLDDIQRISSLTSLRFIVATHSPQIIHKWWDRTVALGDQDPESE